VIEENVCNTEVEEISTSHYRRKTTAESAEHVCMGPQRLRLSETRCLILQQIKTQVTTPTSCGCR